MTLSWRHSLQNHKNAFLNHCSLCADQENVQLKCKKNKNLEQAEQKGKTNMQKKKSWTNKNDDTQTN